MPEIISATLFDTIKEELPNNQVSTTVLPVHRDG